MGKKHKKHKKHHTDRGSLLPGYGSTGRDDFISKFMWWVLYRVNNTE